MLNSLGIVSISLPFAKLERLDCKIRFIGYYRNFQGRSLSCEKQYPEPITCMDPFNSLPAEVRIKILGSIPSHATTARMIRASPLVQ
ncbi:Uncharacterized protein HZ326_7855 [Fusarium oxysporum f. sp. albedinis]|nr:Uncharacterized protein HZ326_7855 [Fusarium oxysporum f. sp. albedinis]